MIDEDDVLDVFVVRVFEEDDLCLELFVYEDVLVHGDDAAKLVARNLRVKLALKTQKLKTQPKSYLFYCCANKRFWTQTCRTQTCRTQI